MSFYPIFISILFYTWKILCVYAYIYMCVCVCVYAFVSYNTGTHFKYILDYMNNIGYEIYSLYN